MHLLNTKTLVLEPRSDKRNQYAILSHRWEDEEVLFEHITGDHQRASQLKGWAKVLGACAQAERHGLTHIWIDTCCINKSSSSELSEAINSMFAWYREAVVCYVYLSDVSGDVNPRIDPAFANSQWFTRGWTLQELIAPTGVCFYSNAWKELGSKSVLCSKLAEITGIDTNVLDMTEPLESVSVAKRMSWAAKRETTRLEDKAYALMGLFDVNMPMIYGEGKKAFIRLQEEIMKDSGDETLFAWKDNTAKPDEEVGLLASSPALFEDSGEFFSYGDWEGSKPFSMTNRGLKISLLLRPFDKDVYIAALNCPMPGKSDGFMGIYLKRITAFDDTKFQNQYARVQAHSLVSLGDFEHRGGVTKLHVRQTLSGGAYEVYPEHKILVREGPNPRSAYSHVGSMGVETAGLLRASDKILMKLAVSSSFKLVKARNALAAVLVFQRKDETELAVLLGSLTDKGDVGVDVVPDWSSQNSNGAAHNFNEVKKLFRAQSPNRTFATGKDCVVVKVRPFIKESTKYFMVHIDIEMKPWFMDFMRMRENATIIKQAETMINGIEKGLKETAAKEILLPPWPVTKEMTEIAQSVTSKDSGPQAKKSDVRGLLKHKRKA